MIRLAALLCLAACGRIAFDPRTDGGSVAIDADIPGDAAAACKGPYKAPRNVGEVNSGSIEGGGMLSADGLELYFGSDRAGGLGMSDLYVARRAVFGTPFSAPVHLAAISSNLGDDNPYIEPDGLTLWWQQGSRIVRSVRADRSAAWPAPAVVPELNTGTDDQAVGFTSDGLTVYFSSVRAGGLGFSDIYRATRPTRTSAFGPVVHETTASSNSFDCCPEVTAGDGMVLFTTQRNGLTEIWASVRQANGALGTASLYTMTDSPDPFVDYDVFTTPDDTAIGVTSSRPGGMGTDDIWLYERTCP